MDEIDLRTRKNLRRLDSLSSVRRELSEVYYSAKDAEADPILVQKYRALAFILRTIADVLREEKLEGEFEQRLRALEIAVKAGGNNNDFRIQF